MPTDAELLCQYVKDGSEAAFTELVQRYAGLVYPAALRLVGGNMHLAKDVTQDVFILMARKAPMLIGHESLAGWLHTTTRYIAFRMIRGLRRREVREHEAMAMQTESAPEIQWEQLRPLLDEAVGRLGPRDRDAILLRYFQGKSYGEVGAALGLAENTARVRTERAVEKLRAHFTREGMLTTGALLSALLAANLTQAAPPELVAEVSAVAQAKGLSLGHQFLKIIYMTTKTKLAIAAGVILAVASIPFVVWYQQSARQPADAPQSGNGNLHKIAPTVASNQVVTPVAAPAAPSAAAAVASAQKPAGVDPRAPMPGILPNRPRLMDLIAAGQPGTGEPMMRFLYSNLIQKMRFTPEQADAFIKIQMQKQQQENAVRSQNPADPKIMTAYRNGTMSLDELQSALDQHDEQLKPQIQAVDQTFAPQMQEIFGSADNYNYYLTYTDQNKERSIVDSFSSQLTNAGGTPLTLDQEEQLVNTVYQFRTAPNGNNFDAIPPEQVPQMLKQLGTFLSPDQVQAVQQVLPLLVQQYHQSTVGG